MRLHYRPMPVQRTIGNIAHHLETANYGLCGRFGNMHHARTAKDALPDSVKDHWPKDTLVARLRASLRFCDTAIDRADLESAASTSNLVGFETDLAEHYSQLSVYMRLLGLVPPSALPPKHHTAIEVPEAGDRFFAEGVDAAITFTRDSRGAVTGLVLHQYDRDRPAAKIR